jgi:hypothetical protein
MRDREKGTVELLPFSKGQISDMGLSRNPRAEQEYT